MIATLVAAIPAVLIYLTFTAMGIKVVGIVLAIALVVAVFLLTTIRLSVEEHRMKGAGQYVYKVLLFKAQHRLSRRIYIKPNGEEAEGEEEVTKE